jgi:hypothetical protein
MPDDPQDLTTSYRVVQDQGRPQEHWKDGNLPTGAPTLADGKPLIDPRISNKHQSPV